MTVERTKEHLIQLIVRTPEEYSTNDVVKDVDGELFHAWTNSDDEMLHRREWRIHSINPIKKELKRERGDEE